MGLKNKAAQHYAEILQEIQGCNCIKFAAYRTASKLLVLQKSLGFDGISLQLIRGVFEQHHIRSTDNYLLLTMEEIENVLHDIFFAASSKDGRNLVELQVDLTKYLLNDIFLKNGNAQTISVLSLKIVLVCLSSSSLYSKYHYWFTQLMDHNICLPRRRLRTLLETLLIIPIFLSESNTFSDTLIQPTLDSCYTEEHHASVGINENDFMSWLAKEPQLLVWLSTFYRLSISQKVTHNVECSVCGMCPIVGLRYHCLRCIGYNLCQLCFYTARSNKHHKPRHIIREYCTQTTVYETASTFLKEVFKRICGQSSKLQYLPANNNFCCKSGDVYDSKAPVIRYENKNNLEIFNTPKEKEVKLRTELKGIISDIEKEASYLLSDKTNMSTKHLINQQAQFLQDCLDRVKALQAEANNKTTPADEERESVRRERRESEMSQSTAEKEVSLCVPSMSGFSTWIEEAQHETTYTKQLHSDLEAIMTKLNNMLESNFSINEDN